jgi:hypothetical protein
MKQKHADKYVLRSGSFFVGNLDAKTMQNPLVQDRKNAMVLDWRDNETAKAAFFSALLGAPFTPEKL